MASVDSYRDRGVGAPFGRDRGVGAPFGRDRGVGAPFGRDRSVGAPFGDGAGGYGGAADLEAEQMDRGLDWGPDWAPDWAIDYRAYVSTGDDGLRTLHLMVEGITCGACIFDIEQGLGLLPGIVHARVNLSTRRLVVRWQGEAERAVEIVRAVVGLGYRPVPYDPVRLQRLDHAEERELLRALAVAGFAAGNVMLLSVSIWAGHAEGMGEATRTLLHWFSAMIVLPAVLYAGRPFFRAAVRALAAGRTCMEVPISVGVLLASGMSVFETLTGGPHAYFDSAITLLFFLLISRFLDRRARGQARAAAERLLALDVAAVTVLADGAEDTAGAEFPAGTARSDGSVVPEGAGRRLLPADQVRPGMTVLVAMGEKIAVDGRVRAGRSELDTSLITGETLPTAVGEGDPVFAGTLNLSAPLTLTVTAVGDNTLLGEIVRLMELSEQRKGRFVALADRIARLYTPLVHALAAITFLGWMAAGFGWHQALMTAVAVLIVTCPCALGLAVPVVQVVASNRLMRAGVLLKSATALERLARVDTVVFDKTGTLTTGRARLISDPELPPDVLPAAAALAGASRHPLARSLARAVPTAAPAAGVEELPGQGLRWCAPDGSEHRLGSRAWCGAEGTVTGGQGAAGQGAAVGQGAAGPGTGGQGAAGQAAGGQAAGPELWFRRDSGGAPWRIGFADPTRADAGAVVAALKGRGLAVELLSGDRPQTVAAVAAEVGLAEWRGSCRPADKVARLAELRAQGRRVLMVGDGLNDAPALAEAMVSLSPSSAADLTRVAADGVFQGGRLAPILETLRVARRAERLVTQNFMLAAGYNALAVPLAMAGWVTPLVAAILMSVSSLAVVINALRLVHSGGSRDPSWGRDARP